MTYQDKAKQKARELTQDEDGILSIGKYDHEIIDTLISQTITDLLDELEEVMGKESTLDKNENCYTEKCDTCAYNEGRGDGINQLHRELTKKFNQIRE